MKNAAGFTQEQIAEMKDTDLRYHLHPTSSFVDIKSWGGPRVICEAVDDIRMRDVDGRVVIDAGSGLYCNNLGFQRAEVAQVAYDQMMKLNYFQTFNGFSHPGVISLSKTISDMVPMDDAKICYMLGGADSNDSGYKIARFYWDCLGRPDKNFIISRSKAYHGVSYGALSATQFEGLQDGFEPLLPGFDHILEPHCYFCPFGLDKESCSLECATALEEKILELGPENVAAFTAEPIIGAGGVIVPPPGYYQQIREICDRHDVLFITDEVVTAFGRSGKMFGILHWEDVQPDIMLMGKGISGAYFPMAAVAVSGKVFAPIDDHGTLKHGYTYAGHPVGCAVVAKCIEIVEREGLVENARVKGELLRSRIAELDLPCVGEIRGEGLLNAVQFVSDRENRTKFDPKVGFAARVADIAWDNGLLVRVIINDCLQLSPILSVKDEDIDEIVTKLGQATEQALVESAVEACV
jgi:putrescine aminotransferase